MDVRIIEVNPRELKYLETNARYMRHEEFNRLCENIRHDGKLTSVPFCCKDDDGRYLILSGNHRVKAAVQVGLPTITVMVTDDPLSEDQRIAIQLSHNAIAGQDDPATLKLLYEKILDTDMKKYSGLDDKTLELLDKFSSMSISEANLRFETVSMVFLPDELDVAQNVIDHAINLVKQADAIWLCRHSEYDKWLDAQEIASSSYNVKNVATAVDIILKVFANNVTQLSEGWEESDDDKRWVPIETVIGRSKIPSGSAKVIKQALERMAGKGDITPKNLWQGLEYLCADYLGG